MAKPPTVAELTWRHDLAFDARSGDSHVVIDGDSREGQSPVQSLAFALAGCMTTDVAHILTKGRHPFRTLHSRLVAERAPDEPHRFVKANLHVTVGGDVPAEAVARAIQLSREKYCSVWHSMRQDIDFTTSFAVEP